MRRIVVKSADDFAKMREKFPAAKYFLSYEGSAGTPSGHDVWHFDLTSEDVSSLVATSIMCREMRDMSRPMRAYERKEQAWQELTPIAGITDPRCG